MKVSLTSELERRIAEKMESGLYASASEVVREGLRLLFETDALQDRQLAQLRADIQVGLDQADGGELLDGVARARQDGPGCPIQHADVTRYVLTPIAEEDIKEIGAWIAGHNPSAAERFVDPPMTRSRFSPTIRRSATIDAI